MSIKGFTVNGTTVKYDYMALDNLPVATGKLYNPVFDETQIVGHRADNISGNPSGEDSTFEYYKGRGIKVIEADIRHTKDKVPVLHHDAAFSSGGTSYTISNWNYNASVAAAGNLDKLEDLVKNCKKFNIGLYLDIKDGTTANITATYNIIRDWGMIPMTIFGTVYKTPAVVEVLGNLSNELVFDYVMTNSASVDTALSALPPCAQIVMHYDGTSTQAPSDTIKNAIKYAHQKGLKAYAWTIDTKSVANAYLDAKADWVMSNDLTNSDIE